MADEHTEPTSQPDSPSDIARPEDVAAEITDSVPETAAEAAAVDESSAPPGEAAAAQGTGPAATSEMDKAPAIDTTIPEQRPQAPQTKRRSALIWVIAAGLVLITVVAVLVATGTIGGEGSEGWSWLTGGGPSGSADTTDSGNGAVPPPGSGQPGGSGQPSTSGQPGMGSAGRPTETAADGSELTTITVPPDSTLAMINADRMPADARYVVTFRPYGFGPQTAGATLVVRITAAEVEGESASDIDFVDRNVLARLAPGEEPVTVGGTYTAVLTFRPQGDLVVPYLSDMSSE